MKFEIKKVLRSLKKIIFKLPAEASYFNTEWYYTHYPDVKKSNINAWQHYYYYGRNEGRLPCDLLSNKLSMLIWNGNPNNVKELEALLSSNNPAEKTFAAWTLARWYASNDSWANVEYIMTHYINTKQPVPGHDAPYLLWIDALIKNNKIKAAKKTIKKLKKEKPNHWDFSLCECNVLKKENNNDFLVPINKLYEKNNLEKIVVTDIEKSLFDSLHTKKATAFFDKTLPLVSIVIPTYNSEDTLHTAINSLLYQTWENIEILIVDDASTDKTLEVAMKLSSMDSRIKVVSQKYNAGTYAARNKGVSLSSGEFITVHDSDDWSHPEKIYNQAQYLVQNASVSATISHWVRASDDLVFGTWKSPAGWDSWTHRNTSSLMIKRSVLNTLGYWDRVNCNADVEYYYRIIKVLGISSIKEILPGIPLSLGRFHDNSLTQRASTNIFSVLYGMRKEYNDAFHNWHNNCEKTSDLYLAEFANQRPFPAPKGMTE